MASYAFPALIWSDDKDRKTDGATFLTQKMSAVAANIDLVLIENKRLEDNYKSLSVQLAQSNQKYNSLLATLKTQYSFMNDIELRMNMIMKRDKPLKQDLQRIRAERNQMKGDNKILIKEKKDLIEARDRLEKENVWLVEQLQLSRRVGQDMEALVSSRMDIYKSAGAEKTDLGEKLHQLHLEKTSLEYENANLKSKLATLKQEMDNSIKSSDNLKKLLLVEQSKVMSLANDNQQIRKQMHSIIEARSGEDVKNSKRLELLQEQVKQLERLHTLQKQDKPFTPDYQTSALQQPLKENLSISSPVKISIDKDSIAPPNHDKENIIPPSKSSIAISMQMKPKVDTSILRKRSPSPTSKNPFFPGRAKSPAISSVIEESDSPGNHRFTSQSSSFHQKHGLESDSKNPKSETREVNTLPDGIDQPTFLAQEALESQKALAKLDSQISNLEKMFE